MAKTIFNWNGYSCCSTLPFELIHRVSCYSLACLHLQSLVLNSVDPSLKQGHCFVAAVFLRLNIVTYDGTVAFDFCVDLAAF